MPHIVDCRVYVLLAGSSSGTPTGWELGPQSSPLPELVSSQQSSASEKDDV